MISRGCSITGLVCLPRKISARHYMKLLHLSRGDELYKINFEFTWKQPPTKKSSQITFFWNFFWKNLLLHKWLAIGNFDRFAAAIIFFSARFLNMCNCGTLFYLVFNVLSWLDCEYMEIGQPAYQSGQWWWKKTCSVSYDQISFSKWNLSFFQDTQ